MFFAVTQTHPVAPVRTTSFLSSLTKTNQESVDNSSFVRKTSFMSSLAKINQESADNSSSLVSKTSCTNSVMKGIVEPVSCENSVMAVAATRLRDISDSEGDDDYASFRGKKQSKKKTADLMECKRALAVSPSGSEVVKNMRDHFDLLQSFFCW
jgi:hypothetical protein